MGPLVQRMAGPASRVAIVDKTELPTLIIEASSRVYSRDIAACPATHPLELYVYNDAAILTLPWNSRR